MTNDRDVRLAFGLDASFVIRLPRRSRAEAGHSDFVISALSYSRKFV
jgi:hypothetical protein